MNAVTVDTITEVAQRSRRDESGGPELDLAREMRGLTKKTRRS